MDSFDFSVALNAEIQLIHIEQKYNFYYPDSLSLIYIFCAAIKSEKHKLKWGGGGGHGSASVSSQNDEGAISASNDHFARGDWSEFQDKRPFSRVELSKSLLKA